jgi:hypothetical protein
MIAFAAGSFGISMAIDRTMAMILNREMAASLATGDVGRIRSTFVSAMVLSAGASALLIAASSAMALLVLSGVFKTDAGRPELNAALAALFFCEGLHTGFRILVAPYRQSLFASQRIATENSLVLLSRIMRVISVVAVFSFILPGGPLDQQICWYAGVNVIAMSVDTVCAIFIARKLIHGLQLSPSAFRRAEFRQLAKTGWHVGQMMILMDFNAFFMSILINLFFGVAYNGLWQIAVLLGGYATLVGEGILRGIDALAANLKEKGNLGGINLLLTTSIRYQLAAALPWIAMNLIFMKPILWVWIGNRLQMDESLVEAGLTVNAAIDLVAIMATIQIMASLCRTFSRGIERVLYGMGLVHTYAWFAKYAVVSTLALAALMFWRTGSPVWAPVPIVLMNFLYYEVVILLAARREVGFRISFSIKKSLPGPVLAAALFCLPLLAMRSMIGDLTLSKMAFVLAVSGAVYAPLAVGLVLQADERSKILQLVRKMVP